MDIYNLDDTEIFSFKRWWHLILIMSTHNILIFSFLKYEAYLQIHDTNMNTCQNYVEYMSKCVYWNIIQIKYFSVKKRKGKKILRFPIKNSNKTLDSW